MSLPRLARFNDERRAHPVSVSYQMVVKPGDRQQSGNRGVLGVKSPVRENQDVGRPFSISSSARREHVGERFLESLGSLFWDQKGVGITSQRNFSPRMVFSFSISGVRKKRGPQGSIFSELFASGRSMLAVVPSVTMVPVISSSRMASIAGFVTWANICLK